MATDDKFYHRRADGRRVKCASYLETNEAGIGLHYDLHGNIVAVTIVFRGTLLGVFDMADSASRKKEVVR